MAIVGVARAVLYELLPLTWKDLREIDAAVRAAASSLYRNARSASRMTHRFLAHHLNTSSGRQAVRDAVSGLLLHRTLWIAAAWVAVWRLFVRWEFGSPFCMVSAIALIFLNLGERKQGELSAYSVFNRDQYRLPGTFTAEQYERELLHR
jgi:hypothetical protein